MPSLVDSFLSFLPRRNTGQAAYNTAAVNGAAANTQIFGPGYMPDYGPSTMPLYNQQVPLDLNIGAYGPDAPSGINLFGQEHAIDPTALSQIGAPANGGGGFWDGMLGKDGQQGWGSLALGGASLLANGFMGMKQYGLAKDQLKQAKKEFNLNYNAQRQTVNTQLEDRQRARVASNPGAYQSVGDYMKQHAIA